MKKISWFLFCAVLFLTGCSSLSGWSPTVDARRDRQGFWLHQNTEECRQLASQASGQGATVRDVAWGVGMGGVIGAAGGAAVGAILGDPFGVAAAVAGVGAMLGAVYGGTSGTVYQGMNADNNYRYTFSNCLKQRGHAVINQ